MWDYIGRAVVEERVRPPRRYANLTTYARLEYGKGTEAASLIPNGVNGQTVRLNPEATKARGSRFPAFSPSLPPRKGATRPEASR